MKTPPPLAPKVPGRQKLPRCPVKGWRWAFGLVLHTKDRYLNFDKKKERVIDGMLGDIAPFPSSFCGYIRGEPRTPKPAKRKQPGPVIPKGWRRLLNGEIVRYTDKFWAWNEGPWKRFGGCVRDAEETIGTKVSPHLHPIIRRSPAGRKG